MRETGLKAAEPASPSGGGVGRPPMPQFGAIPSDFTSGPTISISVFMRSRSSSGVVVLVSTPLACSRAASCGSREALMN